MRYFKAHNGDFYFVVANTLTEAATLIDDIGLEIDSLMEVDVANVFPLDPADIDGMHSVVFDGCEAFEMGAKDLLTALSQSYNALQLAILAREERLLTPGVYDELGQPFGF
jgi:hypothetical protein